jgi:hypothetical protein
MKNWKQWAFVAIIAIFGIMVGFTACDNGGGGENKENKENDTVYIAGIYYDGVDYAACYWKDGVKTDLPVPSGTVSSRAFGIVMSEGSIYISGWYTKIGTTPCYWKDGVRIDLPDTGFYTDAITVSKEGSVYVLGRDNSYKTIVY